MLAQLLGLEIPVDTATVINWITGGAAVSLPGLVQYLRKQAKRIAENLDKIDLLEARIVELEKRCGAKS